MYYYKNKISLHSKSSLCGHHKNTSSDFYIRLNMSIIEATFLDIRADIIYFTFHSLYRYSILCENNNSYNIPSI